LISYLRRVLIVVFFLSGDSLASEFCMPTFRNTLFHLHSRCKQEEFFLLIVVLATLFLDTLSYNDAVGRLLKLFFLCYFTLYFCVPVRPKRFSVD